jgi:O-antigen ligase
MSLWRFNTVFNLVIALVALVAVMFPNLIGPAFLAWILTALVGLIVKQVQIVRPSPIGFLFLGLFLLYLLGTLFTNHPDIAKKLIEYKLSFTLIPILFVIQPKSWKPDILKTGFIVAVFSLSIYHLLLLSIDGRFTMGLKEFTSSNFSTLHHPSYFSAFAFLATLFSIEKIVDSTKRIKKILLFGLVVFFIFIQVFCLSLAGMLFLMLFFILFGLYVSYKIFGKKGALFAIVALPLIVILSVSIIPGFKEQFVASKLYLNEYVQNPIQFVQSKKTFLGGNETRLIMWTASAQEIAAHPFGVGTGNVDDHLESRLQSLSHYEMAKKMYNPHNQYLQSTLEIGFLGAVVLLSIIVYCVVIGIRYRNWILLLFILNFAFNCLFESMLQRQSGIVFYVFWICLLVLLTKNSHSQKLNKLV